MKARKKEDKQEKEEEKEQAAENTFPTEGEVISTQQWENFDKAMDKVLKGKQKEKD